MFTGFIKIKLKETSYFRWLLAFLFMIVVAFFNLKFDTLSDLQFNSLLEYTLYQTNDQINLCYIMTFLIVIVGADIYNGAKNTFDDNVFLKVGNRKRWLLFNLLYIFLLCSVISVTFAVINISFGLQLKIPLISYSEKISTTIIDNMVELSFWILRSTFLCLTIFAINLKTKNYPIGFVVPFAICFIDMFAYEILDIMEPMNLLPIEHSRTFYTEAVAPMIESSHRLPYIWSYCYWFFLISIVCYICKAITNKKDFMIQEIKE